MHTLHQVKAVGSQPLDSFKEMLTKNEFRKYQSNPQLEKTWFKLTMDVFIAILFWVKFISKLDFQANVMFVDSSPHMLSLIVMFVLWKFAARDRWGLWWCCQKVLWRNTRGGEDQFRNDIRDEGCSQSQAIILQGLVLKVHISCKSQVWWWILAWG